MSKGYKETVYRPEYMSEETRRYIRIRRKRMGITTLIALLTLVVLAVGERNSLMDQIDWIVEAMHGPADIKSIKTQVFRLQQNLYSFENSESNQLYDIRINLREVDEKLSLPSFGSNNQTNMMTYFNR